ncbi:MAG: hypothetical protein RJA52_959 [Bacteroidota bacterium]|jgi:hypothetical protein
MKNILSLLLMLAVVACGPAQQETTSEETTTEEVTSAAVLSGENFEVVMIDAEASSPRKEMRGTVAGVPVTVNYGSPAVKGRTIWGDLVAYDQVWRTGANAATTIEFEGDVTVEGQPLMAGKYALFTIPGATSWQVIFNKVTDQWGAGSYDEAQNALSVTVTPQAREELIENLEFTVNGNSVVIHWENIMVPFAVATTPAE